MKVELSQDVIRQLRVLVNCTGQRDDPHLAWTQRVHVAEDGFMWATDSFVLGRVGLSIEPPRPMSVWAPLLESALRFATWGGTTTLAFTDDAVTIDTDAQQGVRTTTTLSSVDGPPPVKQYDFYRNAMDLVPGPDDGYCNPFFKATNLANVAQLAPEGTPIKLVNAAADKMIGIYTPTNDLLGVVMPVRA